MQIFRHAFIPKTRTLDEKKSVLENIITFLLDTSFSKPHIFFDCLHEDTQKWVEAGNWHKIWVKGGENIWFEYQCELYEERKRSAISVSKLWAYIASS